MTRTDLPRALEDSRNRVLRNFRTIPIAEYRRTFNGRSRGSDFHQEYEFSTGYIITHSSDGLRVSAILVHEEAILAKVHLQKGKITCRDEIKKDFFFDRSPPSSGAAVIVF